MPAFRPVPAHQACRFSLSFGELGRSTQLLRDDVPDRLLNRVTVNAAVLACGKNAIAELDAIEHAARVGSAPLTARQHPDNFWKRTAGGTPNLRLDGRHGVSQVTLARRMVYLGPAGQDAIERVRRWPLWALIHPDPVDTDALLWLEDLVADLATTQAWFGTTDRSVSPAEQSARLLELVRDDQVEVAVNALWLSLRRSGIEADLPRYASLYHTWLTLRPLLEAHPLFKSAVALVYDFTAYWFGQLEIVTDHFRRALGDHSQRYLDFACATFGSLSRDSDLATRETWEPFRIGVNAYPPGMRVTPNPDFLADNFPEEEGTPNQEFWQNWPLLERITGRQRAARSLRPGVQSRPAGWIARYGTSPPLPVDFDRLVNAATIAKAFEGLEENDVGLYEMAGKLFALRGSAVPEYPWFQTLPGLHGRPLEQVLSELGSPKMSGESVWNFFVVGCEFLAHLSPLEMLLGVRTRTRQRDRLAQQFLDASPNLRLTAVLLAAQAYRERLQRERDRASLRATEKSPQARAAKTAGSVKPST